MWKHLERLGGGVGTRGPGETQLETDRRLARRRVALLRRRLRTLGAAARDAQEARRRSQTPTVALAGYTNVGKSTLLNALTGAEVSVDDRLFETLDPTTRGFDEDGRRYLVTDTVGFIRRLPHQLVEAFAATLEETLVADLVLLVADASAAEDGLDEMLDAVERVLDEIGADEMPVELVLNKIDAVDALHAPAAGEPVSRTRCWSRPGPARGSTSCGAASPSASPTASSRPALDSVCGRRAARRAVRARRADRRARGPAEGVFVRARLPRERGAPVRGLPAGRAARGLRPVAPVIELPVRRLREDAVLPERAYAGDAGLDLAASSGRARRPASGPWSAPGSPSRSPRATPASSSHARASPRGTASRS